MGSKNNGAGTKANSTHDDYGRINPKAPAETAQFDFLTGEWDMTVTYQQPSGEAFEYHATFRCFWIVDGFVLQQDWIGPYARGAEFRTFDPASKKWRGQTIYAGNSWQTTEAEFKDGQMVILIFGAKDASGEFINRETYSDITKNGFKIKSERSYDGGQNWVDGVYSMTAKRIK